MITLVVGATGGTGRLLVQQLLDRGTKVNVIVRSPDRLAQDIRDHPQLSVTHANLLDLDQDQLMQHINGCDAVASCLGHSLSLRGMYGSPRKLVTQATARLCTAINIQQTIQPIKFVLMNTAGNSNRDLAESISFAEKASISLVRLLVPPHSDNEQAADYLRLKIGQNNPRIEWAVVRPDSLTNHPAVTEYQVHRSPTRSALFNAAKTSRMNVAHFMAELITKPELWERWQGQMPVIYNTTQA